MGLGRFRVSVSLHFLVFNFACDVMAPSNPGFGTKVHPAFSNDVGFTRNPKLWVLGAYRGLCLQCQALSKIASDQVSTNWNWFD